MPSKPTAALKSFDAAAAEFCSGCQGGAEIRVAGRHVSVSRAFPVQTRGNRTAPSRPPKQYAAAAATFDASLKGYPQSKYLAQVLYTRGDCAYHAGQKADAVRFYVGIPVKRVISHFYTEARIEFVSRQQTY